MGGSWWDAGGKGAGGKGGSKKHLRKHAFKLLCPDPLITSIMGPRGSVKDRLESETGCKIIFSNREEFFPGTLYRTFCVYAEMPEVIDLILDQVVEHIVQCGEAEMQHGAPSSESDFLGKDEGTFVVRAAVSVRMAGVIIGPKGANVKAIREETNSRLVVEKNCYCGHQMLRIVGAAENLKAALCRVNEMVQQDVDTEEFVNWANIRVFHEDAIPSKGKGREEKGKGKGKPIQPVRAALPDRPAAEAQPRQHDRSRTPMRPRGPPQDYHQPLLQAQQAPRPASTGPGDSPSAALKDEGGMLQALAATLEQFPEGTAMAEDYSLTCELPSSKVAALSGKDGEHLAEVQRRTGARVSFQEAQEEQGEQQTLLVEGPLSRVYWAHALMMKRYHDVDVEQANEAMNVKELQSKLADLQKQLDQALRQQSEGGKGKSKGKKG